MCASVRKSLTGAGYIIEKGAIQYQDEMKNILENEEIVKKYLTV
jgi:ABC-type branched-subunit amino acid transport system ATPase component